MLLNSEFGCAFAARFSPRLRAFARIRPSSRSALTLPMPFEARAALTSAGRAVRYRGMLERIAPEELKPRVRERLTLNGVIKRIDREIKKGMCTAIGTIRGQDVDESYFAELGFRQTGAELGGLHAVLDYLQGVGLTWTRDCLEQEAHIAAAAPPTPLLYLIHPELREPPPAADALPEGADRDGALLSQNEDEEEEEEDFGGE
jgi:hypothetical protein